MIRLLTIISIFCLPISIDCFGQLPIWLQKVGDGNTVQVLDITRDEEGNIYSTGSFSGTFNSTVGSFNSNGLSDIFISKTNTNGKLEWVRTFGGSIDDIGTGLCIDNAGNLIITGICQDTVVFGNDTLPGNAFITKLNPLGNVIWAVGIGNNSSMGKNVICIDTNIFIVGQFSNPFIIGPDTLINYGSTDIFVAQMNSSGIALRGTEIGSVGVDEPFSISKFGDDNILVSGKSSSGGGFSFGTDLALPNTGECFIGRYNFLTHHWIAAKAIRSDVVYSTCDDNKNTYLSGTFTSQANLDTIQFIGTGMFVSKFDSSLNVQWAKSVTTCTSCLSITNECGLNRQGDIFFSGDFVNNIIVGNDTLASSGGGSDLFIAKITNDGNWINAQQGMSDFKVIKRNGQLFNPHDFNELHEQSLNFIKKEIQNATSDKMIVVTHHVPTFLNYPAEYKGSDLNEAFAVELFDLIEESAVDYWLYGHNHRNQPDFDINRTKMITNQLGYVKHGENQHFDSKKCINT